MDDVENGFDRQNDSVKHYVNTLEATCVMVIAKNKKLKYNTIKNMEEWTQGSDPPNNVPRAVFIPNSNSLSFDERRVTLEEPVKIGRYVYRGTPSATNTIFECRVLSRHHATLYYENGHFFLVDNQSSNGTFINNNRCSITKVPHEVFSGDVVQFGIPVVENAGNSEKNTFPPVVALLKLYHPDGKEASSTMNTTMSAQVHLKEMYQLNNFVQEAVQREAALESRLRTLRECVERTRAEAESSWELFVGEQRLLMRVHTLETMLAVGKQPDTEHVTQLLNDKENYQEVAQESLRVAHEQRLALEESLERRSREAAALQQHNYALRLAANNALAELQKLTVRCERKTCAARLAIAAAEKREQTLRDQLPLAYSVQNGEAKMLVLSTDSNKLEEANLVGSLEDAVRALPDYIKMLLPQHLLNKVGIKLISGEGKTVKEFELILKKNNIYNSENKENNDAKENAVNEDGDMEEKSGEPDLCTDDEKQSRLNHDGHEESGSLLDGELQPDNNANSTYVEQVDKDEVPSKATVEYANVLRVMAGLNDEIKVLRERVAARGVECDELRAARDQLLAAHEPAPLGDPDLQTQLARATATEEANLAEIQRLSASVSELQAELSFRPTRADLDGLVALSADLRKQLDEALANLHKSTVDKATETATTPDDIDPTKISADIDEMFRLDFEDDDEETDSAVTEINKDEPSFDTSNFKLSEYVKLDDEERLQVTMQNGSLHALEEELIRAKERWAEVAEERARLAAQLATLQNKPLVRMRLVHVLALLVPVAAAALCYALLPHVS